MSTLGVMKARVADELARSDLTSQIASAIGDAVAAYQTERFFFNESRDVTFPTVPGQEFYTAADNPNIPDLLAIDYVALQVGSVTRLVAAYRPDVIENVANAGTHIGEPYAYCTYDRKLRLYPVPAQAWTVRIAGQIKIAVPASDDDASNAWMNEAERLIRARAKMELAIHVLRDYDLAAAMAAAVAEAETQLKGRSNRHAGTGRVRAMGF